MNPQPPLNENNNNSFAHGAAKVCLIVPVLGILLAIAQAGLVNQSHNPTQMALLFSLAGCVLLAAGVAAAIVALAGIGAYGPQGLQGRGIAGLALNGILIIFFGFNLVQAQHKAADSRKALKDFQASTADIRSDIRKSFDSKNGITNVDVERVDRLSSQLKNASQNLSGDDARIASVMAGFLDQSRDKMKNYQTAVENMRNAHVLTKFSPDDKGELDTKREVVQKFLQANGNLEQFMTNAEETIRANLTKEQVAKGAIEQVLAGYHASAGGANSITMEIRKCDDRLGNSMLDALNTLETQWGHWKVDTATDKLLFTDSDTRLAYNKSIEDMRAAADEQVQWQSKLINRQQQQVRQP
jgi:hypothetical protein